MSQVINSLDLNKLITNANAAWPTLVAQLEKTVVNWESNFSDIQKGGWILEAWDSFDECKEAFDSACYEIEGLYTFTGNPVVIYA
jgi:hypothetical protein